MSTTTTTVANAPCPGCETAVTLPSVALVGELLSCGSCGIEIEVVSTGPVTLALAPEVEEDWGE